MRVETGRGFPEVRRRRRLLAAKFIKTAAIIKVNTNNFGWFNRRQVNRVQHRATDAVVQFEFVVADFNGMHDAIDNEAANFSH